LPRQNANRLVGVIAGVLLLTLLFVSYRVRTFHYCASLTERPQARVAAGAESCGPEEEPLQFERLGWPGKIKLAARATAKAFGIDYPNRRAAGLAK
jgi:hypothetical protein